MLHHWIEALHRGVETIHHAVDVGTELYRLGRETKAMFGRSTSSGSFPGRLKGMLAEIGVHDAHIDADGATFSARCDGREYFVTIGGTGNGSAYLCVNSNITFRPGRVPQALIAWTEEMTREDRVYSWRLAHEACKEAKDEAGVIAASASLFINEIDRLAQLPAHRQLGTVKAFLAGTLDAWEECKHEWVEPTVVPEPSRN